MGYGDYLTSFFFDSFQEVSKRGKVICKETSGTEHHYWHRTIQYEHNGITYHAVFDAYTTPHKTDASIPDRNHKFYKLFKMKKSFWNPDGRFPEKFSWVVDQKLVDVSVLIR